MMGCTFEEAARGIDAGMEYADEARERARRIGMTGLTEAGTTVVKIIMRKTDLSFEEAEAQYRKDMDVAFRLGAERRARRAEALREFERKKRSEG
jgi:hypothetical protein